MSMTDIKSMPEAALQGYFAALGEPKFRAGQVYRWLHEREAASFEEMTDLPAGLRQRLQQDAFITTLSIRTKQVSAKDGTIKYLLALPDGEAVEAVLMQYSHGPSLCISTQVGCRMGCAFCASTLSGLSRNLTAAEMLEEVYLAGRDSGSRISSVVLMGIGEPLDNFDNVMDFLEILSSPTGKNLSLRHVSLSTCGLVDGIRRLMQRDLQLTLSISLHAPNDELRNRLMPVNRRWPIAELMAACREYFRHTHRRISFEYTLMEGVNDTPACARQLIGLLAGTGGHLNLISVNPVAERGFQRTSDAAKNRFIRILTEGQLHVTMRRELGDDIDAACGQLRSRERSQQDGNIR